MNSKSRIYVAGHTGLIGSALVRTLQAQGYENLTLANHADLDLRDYRAVQTFFTWYKPEYVFVAAGKSGGIDANEAAPVDFLLENVQIGTNIISCAAAAQSTVKLLYLASTAAYPRDCQQPIREDYLLTMPLEARRQWQAMAVLSCIKLCEAYQKQHGKNFITAISASVYGLGDNYKPAGRLLPRLIRRFHDSKQNANPVYVGGDHAVRREFIYSDDLARACVLLMENYNSDAPINIGCGADLSIQELAGVLSAVINVDQTRIAWAEWHGHVAQRYWLDTSKIMAMGWKPSVQLHEGLALVYQDFLKRHF